MEFHAPDVIAAIQHVMDKRFKTLTKNCGLSNREAYEKVYMEFERSIADSMQEAARNLWLEGGRRK